jgi:hypothetical protein
VSPTGPVRAATATAAALALIVLAFAAPLPVRGSCSPPTMQGLEGGVLFSIQAKVPGPGLATLVAAANSAIVARPR